MNETSKNAFSSNFVAEIIFRMYYVDMNKTKESKKDSKPEFLQYLKDNIGTILGIIGAIAAFIMVAFGEHGIAYTVISIVLFLPAVAIIAITLFVIRYKKQQKLVKNVTSEISEKYTSELLNLAREVIEGFSNDALGNTDKWIKTICKEFNGFLECALRKTFTVSVFFTTEPENNKMFRNRELKLICCNKNRIHDSARYSYINSCGPHTIDRNTEFEKATETGVFSVPSIKSVPSILYRTTINTNGKWYDYVSVFSIKNHLDGKPAEPEQNKGFICFDSLIPITEDEDIALRNYCSVMVTILYHLLTRRNGGDSFIGDNISPILSPSPNFDFLRISENQSCDLQSQPDFVCEKVKTTFNKEEMKTVKEKSLKYIERGHYTSPPLACIRTESTDLSDMHIIAQNQSILLDSKLKEFGVNAKVKSFTVSQSATLFEIHLANGTRVAQVTKLEKDIAYVLGTPSIRLEVAIEGKNAIGVEVSNREQGIISIRDILQSKEFVNHKSPLAAVIGKNIHDQCIIADITSMPHLLIAGSTGSGKSVCINSIIMSLLYRVHPDDVKLILVDLKRVELSLYNNIPHMLFSRVICEVQQTISVLEWLQLEMARRYRVLESNGINNISLYHAMPGYKTKQIEQMPFIVMIIDEAADLMQRAKDKVEPVIKSLSSLARACGIHIIMATQRPSADVITGVIKANFPTRISFRVMSRGDSTSIIGESGAEKLIGRGDMLYMHEGRIQRVQGAFVDLNEARQATEYIRANYETNFEYGLEKLILDGQHSVLLMADSVLLPILEWLVRDDNITKTASVAGIQRQFNFGFSRAGQIIDRLAAQGFVSEANGSKVREVLVTKEEVENFVSRQKVSKKGNAEQLANLYTTVKKRL